jgi:hypothetical protein
MSTDIEKLREIYVTDDVDEDVRADNLAQIVEWETQLRDLEDLKSWMEHKVTQEILARARKSYVDHSLLLARSRELTDTARFSLWAKQDAMMWFTSLASSAVDRDIEAIKNAIRVALNAT